MTERGVLWLLFGALITLFLAIDLRIGGHHKKAVSVREAATWSALWIGLALAFGGVIWWELGRDKAAQYLTGYLLEKALSVDNMFVFIMVFAYFGVPPAHQPRVLKWGIFGALAMRGALIALGTAIIQRFHWVLYIFAVLLIWGAYKMLTQGDSPVEPEKNPVLRLFRRILPVKDDFDEDRFFTVVTPRDLDLDYSGTSAGWKQAMQEGQFVATTLLVVLIVIETTDLVFALDSIPAVFNITQDPFIVFTSNVFAILGLRALFFLLAGVMHLFRFLKIGVAAVLFFIGGKMLAEAWVHISTEASLGVVACVLAGSVVLSVLVKPHAGAISREAAPRLPGPAVEPLGGKETPCCDA